MADNSPKKKEKATPPKSVKKESASKAEVASRDSPRTPPDTEEWTFTVNRKDGEIVKVETLDNEGEQRELTQEEYAWLLPERAQQSPLMEEQEGAMMDAETEAYYQGMADYEAAAGGEEYYGTPEEDAYYQGMADYEAAGDEEYYGTPEEDAYYQGMADYEAAAAGY